MLRSLFRILIILAVVGVLFFFFAPRFFNNAANSLISSVNSSVAQAQGVAQYIPPGVTSQGSSKLSDLQVKLNDLLSNSTYDITLDQGQCGNVWKDLGSIKADGSGNFDKQIPVSTLDLTKTWFVDIHQQNASGASVACGTLETNQTTGAQAIDASHSGQSTSGGAPSSSSPASSPGLPNTGANPGNTHSYDNNQYPRKY